MAELNRLGDMEKCPACGWSIDREAYRCPKCLIYFCFKCRARVLKDDPQYQCSSQSCSCYGKLLCSACTGMEHRSVETPSLTPDPKVELTAYGCGLWTLAALVSLLILVYKPYLTYSEATKYQFSPATAFEKVIAVLGGLLIAAVAVVLLLLITGIIDRLLAVIGITARKVPQAQPPPTITTSSFRCCIQCKAPVKDVLASSHIRQQNITKGSFDVILKGYGGEKIQVIKAVREATGLGLKEATELVEGTPTHVKNGVSKKEADMVAAALREAGAEVAIT